MVLHSLKGKQDFEITAAFFIHIRLEWDVSEFLHSVDCVKTKHCYRRTNDILACLCITCVTGNLKSADFLIFAINPCFNHS